MKDTLSNEVQEQQRKEHEQRIIEWRKQHNYPWKKRLSTKKEIKGMIFLGCSFTWGQGLYYYSNLDSLREPPPDHYDTMVLTRSHIEFMKTLRYPRLVANHFNTFEYVAPHNGGSNQSTIEWCEDSIFGRHGDYEPAKHSEISHLVFQLTQWQRKHFFVTHKGQTLDLNNYNHASSPRFTDYLIDNNMTMDDFEDWGVQQNLIDVKNFLMSMEAHGIKTYIMSWPGYYLKHIENDDFLSSRFLTFSYKGKNYSSLDNLMFKNSEMIINSDFEEFVDTPKDHHPSAKCHRLIADTVIKKIESE